MTTDSTALNALTTNNIGLTAFGGESVGDGDAYDTALFQGLAVLNNTAASSLGDRSGQANYRRVLIVLTDASSTTACGDCFQCNGAPNIQNDVWNQGIETFIVKLEPSNSTNINIPAGDPAAPIAVSYTHLTLPTN